MKFPAFWRLAFGRTLPESFRQERVRAWGGMPVKYRYTAPIEKKETTTTSVTRIDSFPSYQRQPAAARNRR